MSETPSLWTDIRADASEAAQFISRPVWIGVLAMLFACGVAVYGFVGVFGVSFFCSGTPPRGANIDRALRLVFLSGLAGPIAIGVVRLGSEAWGPRLWRPLLAAVLLLEAAILGLAVALVALDSATYVEKGDCFAVLGPPEKPTVETAHLGDLYILWSVPIALLLIAVGRLLFEISRFGLGPAEPGRQAAGVS